MELKQWVKFIFATYCNLCFSPLNTTLYFRKVCHKEIGLKLRITSITLLLLFTGYTAFTMSIAQQSLLSFGYQLISSPDTAQVVFDLYIMAFLALVWMYQDCKRLGKSNMYFLPFALLTLVFVSVGPLLYLALKPSEEL